MSNESDEFGSTRKVAFDCPVHGLVEETTIKTHNNWFGGDYCSACRKESLAKEEDFEAHRNKEREIRRREESIKRFSEQSGIPDRFKGKDFDSFVPQSEKAASIWRACKEYAINFPDMRKKGTSLIFCGNAGAGKTHLACSIASHVITSHRVPVKFIRVAKAIRSVKETYSRDSDVTEQEVINRMRAPELLILDEVGVQFGSDAEKNILFEIINERYEDIKPTILISNLALPGLTEYTGERVIDRMKENNGSLFIFDWQSMRGK
jgi:DNA replication protein DnaC